MTRVCGTGFGKAVRHAALAAAMLVFGVAGVAANDAWSSGGRYYGGHNHGGNWNYHRPTPTPTPTPAPTVTRSSNNGGTRSYSAYYRSGRGGYGFLGNQWARGNYSNNGYTGANTYVNRPHRGDWEAKLQAQRRWDEAEYKKMNETGPNNMRCGLSNAPAYCYKLMGPYPTEMRVVRY